jgi:peroxiredoxin
MKQLALILVSNIFFYFVSFAQIADKAENISPLLIGEIIPDMTLKSPEGVSASVNQIINDKPTIFIIYRGGWCPFCNIHLADVQSIQGDIVTMGFNIVAVSPDSPQNLVNKENKEKLAYSLYSDADGSFMKALGVAFKAPDKYVQLLSTKSDGQNEGMLPVPSLFVVDASGKILFEYINPDFKTRISSGLLLAVLKEIK